MDSTNKQKRKVHRSPNYPAFSLGEAITRAAKVYAQEKRSSTTAEVIAKHLGYSHTNGPGGRGIACLRQYGLIEERDGKFRISDRGFALLHYPEGSAERNEALKQAVVGPALFRELLSEYKDGLPSDATLRSALLNRGFNPTMVDEAVRSFRDSVALAGGDNVSYTDPGDADSGHREPMETRIQVPETASQAASQNRPVKSSTLLTQVLPISIPRNFQVEVSIRGDELKREDLDKIKGQFNRWLESLEAAFE